MSNLSVNICEGELQTVDNPTSLFQIVHCDHYDPLTEIADGFKHILVLVNEYTIDLLISN